MNIPLLVFLIAIFAVHGTISFLFGSATIKKGYQGIVAGILTFFTGIVGMLYAISLPVIQHDSENEHDYKMILGAVIFLLSFLSMIGCLMISASVGDAVNDALKDSSETSNVETTDDILAKDLEVYFGEPVYENGKYDTEFSVPVTLTNTSSENHTFSLIINATDAAGNIIDTEPLIADVKSGKSYITDAFVRYGSFADSLVHATFSVGSVSKI